MWKVLQLYEKVHNCLVVPLYYTITHAYTQLHVLFIRGSAWLHAIQNHI